MAKKSTITPGLIKKTEAPTSLQEETPQATPSPMLDEDRVVAVSVALRQSEFDKLQVIADQHHASRGSLLTVVMRQFIEDYEAGRVKPETEKIKFVRLISQ